MDYNQKNILYLLLQYIKLFLTRFFRFNIFNISPVGLVHTTWITASP